MSRDAILGTLRRGLRRGELPEEQQAVLRARMAAHPRHLIPSRSRLPRPEQVALFVANVEKEFGTVQRVADAAAVPAAVAGYVAGQNLPAAVAIAPHPELRAMPWGATLLSLREGVGVGSDQVSVSHGFAGIAETGTLMLPAGPERPTTLNLLPDTAVVVLRTSRIVGPYEDAWDLLRREGADAGPDPAAAADRRFMPRNVMLVTGPSRSADIEQTLELGAHGPRQVHIVLIEDDPEALGPAEVEAPNEQGAVPAPALPPAD